MERTNRQHTQSFSANLKQTIKHVLDQGIRSRYWLALLVFILMLVFKLHGSSINMWDTYVSAYNANSQSGLLFGQPRAVRSDEWLVQTPYSLSQTQSGFHAYNELITLEGQDMMVGYNSPAYNLATLGKPFAWGYLLLGKEYGLSWYWGVKLLGLMLFSFELALIITKRNRYLALVASFWLPFSAALQWWFVSPIGDLIFFALGFLVAIYNYFYNHSQRLQRALLASGAAIMAIGFVLVLYPAFQVPLGYLILLFLFGFFIEFKAKVTFDRWDVVFIGSAICAALVCIGWSVYVSREALAAVMHTIYPGNRISTGGDFAKRDLFLFLTNWKMNLHDVPYENNSELSHFYHFFFVILPLAPWLFYRKVKTHIYGFLLFIYCLVTLGWLFIGVPEWLAKVTLASYVPTYRAATVFGFVAVLLSLWFMDYLWQTKRKLPIWAIFITITLNLALYFYTLYTGNLRLYVTRNDLLLILLVAFLLMVVLFKKWKKTTALLLLGVVLGTGLFVNPIARGVSAIYGKQLATKIQALEKAEPEQLWVGERLMYSYLPALGVHTFNGVAFTPHFDLYKKADPQQKDQAIYNRYAHINVEIKPNHEQPTLALLQQDAIVFRLTPALVKAYGIRYLVTYQALEAFSDDSIRFVKKYGPDTDGTYIYQAVF